MGRMITGGVRGALLAVLVLHAPTAGSQSPTFSLARPVPTGWEHWRAGFVEELDSPITWVTVGVTRVDGGQDCWEEIFVSGMDLEEYSNELEATGNLITVERQPLLLLRGRCGIENAAAAGRLPPGARADLLLEHDGLLAECSVDDEPCREDERHLYVVSPTAIAAIERAMAEEAPSRFSVCNTGTLTKDFAIPSKSVSTEKGAATILGGLTVHGEASARINSDGGPHRSALAFGVKRCFGIPYFIYPKGFTLDVAASFAATVGARGTARASLSGQLLRKELVERTLHVFAFTIGPIPVVIPIDLVIAAGLKVDDVKATGEIDFAVSAEVGFARRWICDLSSCTSEAPSDHGDFTGHSSGDLQTAWVEATAFVDGGVRASLYRKQVAQVTAGIRPGVAGDVFYRAPARGCGDADGDGVEEVVEGRLVDLDGKLDLFVNAGLWKKSWDFELNLLKEHLALLEGDLSPGTASVLTPILETDSPGADNVADHESFLYYGLMRSCWPWTDKVDFELFGEDTEPPATVFANSSPTLRGPAQRFEFTSPGLKINRLTALRDEHPREIETATFRSARVNARPFGFVDGAADLATGTARVPLGGRIAAFGWAADRDSSPGAPVARVVLTAGAEVAAELDVRSGGLALGRPDVASVFERRDFLHSGWQATAFLRRARLGMTELAGRAFDREGGDGDLAGRFALEIVANDKFDTPGILDELDDGLAFSGDTAPQGATVGRELFHHDYLASCGGNGARDAVYRLDLAGSRRLRLSTAGSAFDTVLYVQRDEDGVLTEVDCNDDLSDDDLDSQLDLALPAGKYFVIVDGADPGQEGHFELVARFATENVARGRLARQSSTLPGGEASRAVDGNTDGDFFHGSVTHTGDELEPWWEVDLGGSFNLAGLRLWNRTDCCSNRLAFFEVRLSNDGLTWWRRLLPFEAGSVEWVRLGRTARFVRIQLRGSKPLSLAEVEVLAYAARSPKGMIPDLPDLPP